MTNQIIEFNEQQVQAIEMAVSWFQGWVLRKHRKQVFFLAGYAGTGKTSIAKEIARRCMEFCKTGMHRVVFIAPTGKAASRLRQKGCGHAKTLHQFIYNVRGEDDEGEPIFVSKGFLEESPLMIVMDEASMVGEWDNKKLLDHGFPVLALGDTGQVPPVKAVAVYVAGKEDVLLDKIERNAGNIVRASMFVREGKRLPIREYEDFRVRSGRPTDEDLKEHAKENGQVICSFNNTRQAMNNRIRGLLGYVGDLPQIGEKVICLFNQHGFNFMNGEQGTVMGYTDPVPGEYEDDDDIGMLVILKSLTNGKTIKVKFNPLSFDRNPDVKKEAIKAAGGFDYGYAVTVHKAQGSEWDNVLIIEEAMKNSYAELMYTAITRAIVRGTIYRND